MSLQRPTRREIRNWLALAAGGPYRLTCARRDMDTRPGNIYWQVDERVNGQWRMYRLWAVDSDMIRWMRGFPQ